MKEIWKDIPNYEGYQASNLGRIRTYNKITYTKKHGNRYWENRILKYKEKEPKKHSKHQGKYGTGYRVDLWKDGKPKTFLVSRLIAFTFYNENINNHNLTVNHKDGNRLNNNIKNLELISLQENIQHAYDNGLNTHAKKIKITRKKDNFINIINSLKKGSILIGKNESYISNKIHKNQYENIDYKWELV